MTARAPRWEIAAYLARNGFSNAAIAGLFSHEQEYGLPALLKEADKLQEHLRKEDAALAEGIARAQFRGCGSTLKLDDDGDNVAGEQA